MSDTNQCQTPTTDEHEFDMLVNRYPNMWEKVVKSEIVRDIEHQLAEVRRERDNAISDWKQADTDSIRAIHERNEAREQRDRLAGALRMLRNASLKYKMDEADLEIEDANEALASLKGATNEPKQ